MHFLLVCVYMLNVSRSPAVSMFSHLYKYTQTQIYGGPVFLFSVLMSSYLMEIDLSAQPEVWPHNLIYTNTRTYWLRELSPNNDTG